jgi:glutathione S-transferase
MVPILQALAARLHKQQNAGSRYFIGNQLTALDLYWASMSQLVDAYAPEKNPMPDFFRQIWAPVRAAVESVLDPLLIAHRDFIFTRHLTLPLDF